MPTEYDHPTIHAQLVVPVCLSDMYAHELEELQYVCCGAHDGSWLETEDHYLIGFKDVESALLRMSASLLHMVLHQELVSLDVAYTPLSRLLTPPQQPDGPAATPAEQFHRKLSTVVRWTLGEAQLGRPAVWDTALSHLLTLLCLRNTPTGIRRSLFVWRQLAVYVNNVRLPPDASEGSQEALQKYRVATSRTYLSLCAARHLRSVSALMALCEEECRSALSVNTKEAQQHCLEHFGRPCTLGHAANYMVNGPRRVSDDVMRGLLNWKRSPHISQEVRELGPRAGLWMLTSPLGALFVAMSKGDVRMAEDLWQMCHGALDVRQPMPRTVGAGGWTALHYAVHNGQAQSVAWLLALGPVHGPDLTARTWMGETAEGMARSGGHAEIVKLLSQTFQHTVLLAIAPASK